MNNNRRAIEEVAHSLGLHRTVQSIFRRSIGRSGGLKSASLRGFFECLIRPGDLAFDVGANTGKFSEALDSLGARVVAVEPNGGCARHIELSYPRVRVIQAAVGSANEIVQFFLSDRRSDLGSASKEWVDLLTSQHREYDGIWNRTAFVPCITLDELIRHFGQPNYIKIDVEGFEEAALQGLSIQPPLLSFEFNTANLKACFACLNRFRPESQFNLIVDETPKFACPDWISKDRLISFINAMPSGEQHGDIFASLSGPRSGEN